MMNLWQKRSISNSGMEMFELLRARLEVEVARPAVIVITSSTTVDGKEVAARGLAQSLALAGYATLFADTSIVPSGAAMPSLTLTEIAKSQRRPEPGDKQLTVLMLTDPGLQKSTSQRDVESTFDDLRAKFDYVVISAELAAATSFASSLVAMADAVLVSVRKGRAQRAADIGLSEDLDRMGDRFLGIIALAPAIIDHPQQIEVVAADSRRRSTVREFERREAVESAS